MSQGIGRLPFGVAILAILVGIFGVLVFLVGVLALIGVSAGLVAGSTVFGTGGVLGALIILIIGLVILGVAVGLWHQRLWALILAILVLLFYAAVTIESGSWLSFAVIVILLVYMFLVARHFD